MSPKEDSECDLILESYISAKAAGTAPPVAEFLKQHPGHADALKVRLDALGRIDKCFQSLRDDPAPGDPLPPPPASLQVPGFRLIKSLGRGGMGAVYLAEQISLRRAVALKVMSPLWVGEKQALSRFKREAETVARLSHPGIVPIHAFEAEGDTPHIALDYIPGATLSAIIDHLRSITPPTSGTPILEFIQLVEQAQGDGEVRCVSVEADTAFWQQGYWEICASIIRDAAMALDYAHRNGIIHRDIKPSNIIVGKDGRPRVIDFGLTLEKTADALTKSTDFLGTLLYASPEQVSGDPHQVSEQSDTFSLGVVLYELLTLNLPFGGATIPEAIKSILECAPRRPTKVNPTIPEALEKICMTALSKDRALRYARAVDFANDLQSFRDHASPSLAADDSSQSVLNPRGWQMAMGTLSLLVIAGVWLGSSRNRKLPKPPSPEAIHISPAPTPQATKVPAKKAGAISLTRKTIQLIEARRLQEGITLAPETLRADPNNAELRTAVAGAFLDLKDFPRAIENAEKAISLSPDAMRPRKILAQSYYSSARFAAAAEQFREIVNRAPSDIAARLALATSLASTGDTKSAERELLICLEHAPGNLQALNFLAANLSEQGRTEDALTRYQEALQAGAAPVETLVKIGELHEKLERFQLAIEAYERAAKSASTAAERQVIRKRVSRLIQKLQ